MAIVYQHLKKDSGEIFYIGIGKDKKRAYSNSGRNRYWHNIINKHNYEIEILIENISWELAIEYEILLISFYGRYDQNLGPLVNQTDGGDGSKGHNRKTTLGKIIITKDDKEKRIYLKDLIEYQNLGWKKGRSNKTSINNSISKKGQKPWNFGKTGVYSKDMIEVYKQKAKNRQPMSKETINKMKIAQLGSKHPKAIPVLQYKLNGEFIKEYETISEAQKLIPRTSKIKNVCLGLAKTSGGFIWKFKKPKQNY